VLHTRSQSVDSRLPPRQAGRRRSGGTTSKHRIPVVASRYPQVTDSGCTDQLLRETVTRGHTVPDTTLFTGDWTECENLDSG
jgi:hypothetical protein